MPRNPPRYPWFFEDATPISGDEALEIGDLGNELDQKQKEPVNEETQDERNNKKGE